MHGRRSYGIIRDCEQSRKFFSWLIRIAYIVTYFNGDDHILVTQHVVPCHRPPR